MYYFTFRSVGFSNRKDMTKDPGSSVEHTGHCARKFEGMGFAPDLFIHSPHSH